MRESSPSYGSPLLRLPPSPPRTCFAGPGSLGGSSKLAALLLSSRGSRSQSLAQVLSALLAATLPEAATSTSQPQAPGPAGRCEFSRHLDSAAPVAARVRGLEFVNADSKGISGVREPVGTFRAAF
ncbi:hypothetical protein NDU88_005434 [Pleurodeles waltl]|uniref:Uncharacterized protein n=1 Tax=Pleurodeles waltl TaxID=8319 RepID=A0AAV7TX93_PLEWA|nr:hypothetical protein NDU88_005434 [Pleurodeles waltl]